MREELDGMGHHAPEQSGRMIALRPYQRAALDAAYAAWSAGAGDILITAPCGAGKSLIIAALCQEALASWPETRVLILTHRKELLQQDGAELQRLWPEAPIGYWSAGLGRKDRDTPILFAGVQSVWNRVTEHEPWDLVVIDEAHLLPRSVDTRYGACLASLKLMRPWCRVLGLTATPYRLDSGRLDEGEGALFERVCYDIPVTTLVDAGHLVEVQARGGRAKADLSGVHRRGGDFVPGEVEQAFDLPDLVRDACREVVQRGADRKAWLVFASGVAHAEHVRDELRAQGVDAELVTGETPKGERAALYERFGSGRLRALVNVDLCTVGSNFPVCDMLVLLRATESTALYVQVVGRGMRTYPGKTDCLLLDFGGNVTRHGPIDAVSPRKPGKGDGTAPCKECPSCQSIVPAGVRTCADCGYEWPAPPPRHEARAYEGAVLARQQRTEWVPVTDVRYTRHQKAGRPDSVRVTYQLGLRTVDDWWCVEHSGQAGELAWLKAKAAGLTVRPRTVADLLQAAPGLRVPTAAIVSQDGKYLRIERVRYSEP